MEDLIAMAIAEFDATAERVGGCGDGFCCVTGKATGQHTNGGCRCFDDRRTAQRMMIAGRRLRDRIDGFLKEGSK